MIVRRLSVILCLLSLLSAGAAASAAAATWSQPTNVSGSSLFVDGPFIGYGLSGVGLASWAWQDGVGPSAASGMRVSSRSVSGAYSPERSVPGAGPVIYGRDRVLLLSQTATRRPVLTRIGLAFGRTNGRFGSPETVDVAQIFKSPAVAANDAGRVAVAYVEVTRKRRRLARLVQGDGKRLGSPRTISPRGRVNAITVAIGRRGDLVVAWEREGRIEARVSRRGGRLGRVIRIGRGAKLGTVLRAAVATSGRIWIAWASQRLSEGGGNGPFSLNTAVSSGRGASFQRARVLDRYDRRASDEASFDLSLDATGNGFVAWSSFDGQNFRARLASINPTGRQARFTTLSQPGYGAAVGDLAVSRTGEALVVWSRLDAVGEVGTAVLAGYLPPSGAYNGEEQVSRADRARKPAVAFNPSTGLPTAVWSQREGPDGPGVPLAQIRTFLRSSDRTP